MAIPTLVPALPPSQPTRVTRIALYGRVSKSNGHQDPEMQLRELREYAAQRGLIVVEEYTDYLTGSKDSRPAFNRLMADARRRKVDAVAVWKLDRFGRSLRHLVNTLAELEDLGVAFISLRDNLDLSTSSGRLMFQIIGAMAEFERALIQERVRALVFGLIAKWYLWPAVKDGTPKIALTPLLLYACLRVNGLMFLMPGLVSRELPRAFAVPTAVGDLTAAILALLVLWPLRIGSAVAVPMAGCLISSAFST